MDEGIDASIHGPLDLLSESWCSSAIQVFQPAIRESSVMPLDTYRTSALLKSGKYLRMEEDESKSVPPWKLDDLKSWVRLQQAIHPELDYDLCFRKKWFSSKFTSWTGISIKKWMKEMRRRRKEEKRLRRAEVHAAISVAGLAAALAAIAAEDTEVNKPKSLKEKAVASAAALIAAQCVQVAEAGGAKQDQLASAIDAATTAADAGNIITLTAAAATSLRGAAALRRRPDHRERLKQSTPAIENKETDIDYGRCRTLLSKGDELLVETPDGKCRLRSVSVVQVIDGRILLKIKKLNILMTFSSAKESIIYNLLAKPITDPLKQDSCSIIMTTSKGRVELMFDDYVQYRKWTETINHMLKLSTTFGNYGHPTP